MSWPRALALLSLLVCACGGSSGGEALSCADVAPDVVACLQRTGGSEASLESTVAGCESTLCTDKQGALDCIRAAPCDGTAEEYQAAQRACFREHGCQTGSCEEVASTTVACQQQLGAADVPTEAEMAARCESLAVADQQGFFACVQDLPCEGTPESYQSALIGCVVENSLDVAPVLSEPIVDLSHVVEFLPFGVPLDATRINPTYEIRTDVNTLDVVAAGPGVVDGIVDNEQGDQEISIVPVRASIYTVYYDHVREVAVSVGSTVQPGTKLGVIGTWNGTQGRVEIQVNKMGVPTFAHCPAQFGTSAFNADHAAALAATGSSSAVCVQDTVQQK